jgi:hypothetical protein
MATFAGSAGVSGMVVIPIAANPAASAGALGAAAAATAIGAASVTVAASDATYVPPAEPAVAGAVKNTRAATAPTAAGNDDAIG